MEQKRAGGRPGRMKKKEKKRNGIPARTRRGILAACMVFFFSLQIFQGKMLWRESTGESPGKVLSGKVPAEENERTQIIRLRSKRNRFRMRRLHRKKKPVSRKGSSFLPGSMPVPLRWWMRTAAGFCSEKKSM